MIGPNQRLWLEALRSGDYRQGRMQLEDENGCLCCLGVTARIFGCERDFDRRYDGVLGSAPLRVIDALALYDTCGSDSRDRTCLVMLNDDGKTFKEIADLIEADPSRFFKEER